MRDERKKGKEMIVTAKELLLGAKCGGYAVCAPNITTYIEGAACIQVAEELRAPMLIDIGSFLCKANDPDYIVEFVRPVLDLARIASVPVALQLDHGRSFEDAIQSIHAGMTSVMVDRSSLPFEENVAQTAEIVRIAHACGVSVEAELGHVAFGSEENADGSSGLTEPEEAAEYVERTGIDSLAIAIGTVHGLYKGEPHIDFERLESCRRAVDIPLVLHGGSSSGDDNLKKAAHCGISKINIATDLSQAGNTRVSAFWEENYRGPARTTLSEYLDGYKEKLVHYVKLFGAAGRV